MSPQPRGVGGTGFFENVDQWSGRTDVSIATADAALGDLDGDGDLDAVIAGFSKEAIFLNDGSGRFTPSSHELDSGTAVAIGDVDADGDLDVLLQTDRIWLNDGQARFQPGSPAGQRLTGTNILLSDVNADGFPDIVDDQVRLNDGKGRFPMTQTLPVPLNVRVNTAVGDIDGDGDLDIVRAFNHGRNQIWTNDGKGHFRNTGRTLGDFTSWAVRLGDLDGDGDLDALIHGKQGSVQVWSNNGRGWFFDSHQDFAHGLPARNESHELGDFDGDGDLDVILVREKQFDRSITAEVWVNDGDAVFQPSGQTLEIGPGARRVAIGDLDGDGDLDAFFPAQKTAWLNMNNRE